MKKISENTVADAGNGVQHEVTSGLKSNEMGTSTIAEQVKWFSTHGLSKTSSWTKARHTNNKSDLPIAKPSPAVGAASGTSLHDLPNEMISEIASHLTQESLFAFRQTSKAYEAKSRYVFGKTFCRELKLMVDVSRLEKTSNLLACDLFASQVRSISFYGTGDPLLDIAEVGRLVENILGRIHKANSISVFAAGPSKHHNIHNTIIDKIREAKLPELRSITVDTRDSPVQGLLACLAAHKDTLKSLDVTSTTVEASYWMSLLNYIHDDSRLQKVQLQSEQNHLKQKMDLWRTSSRPCLAFRNSMTGKVDYFAWGPRFARFMGEQAMKQGVEHAIAMFIHHEEDSEPM